MFRFRKKTPVYRKRDTSAKKHTQDAHYRLHRALACEIIAGRVAEWSRITGFSYNRIAIKNQKRCWGSCSAKKNLNFNYKIVFLPESLMEYVIVHEICHLAHLNHGKAFWAEVGRLLPDYRERRAHLRRVTSVPAHGFESSIARAVQARTRFMA